tara:strand:+ start:94 stop:567 length:474 start_codon:yes stop_codon:yes gene_type:complete
MSTFEELMLTQYGTGHLAYYKGTACPITLPYEKCGWLKRAKSQYDQAVAYEGSSGAVKTFLLKQMDLMEGKLNRICAGEMCTPTKIEIWALEMGMTENHLASLWYLNIYTLQYYLGVEVDNDFGILHVAEKPKKTKKQKVNDPCDCGSGKKYKKCCM